MKLVSLRSAAVALSALAYSATAFTADVHADYMKPGKGISVQPIGPGILRHQMEEDIVNQGLRDLGYDVKPTLATKFPLMHVSIANGDADFTTGTSPKLHRVFYDKAGGAAKMTVIDGPLFANMVSAYFVDKKSYDAGVKSIMDLKKPENMKLFDFNNDGKADLVGCQPGWGCERTIEHHMDAYGLRPHVTHLQGEYSVMASDAIARHKSGKSVLYFAWSPHWIQDILQPGKDVEMLEVPFTSIPDRQTKAEDTTFFGKNLGHIPWNMNIMANNEFLKKNPAAHALFKVVRIPIEDVSAQNKLIYEGETSPEDIKRHTDAWIAKHRSAYDGYLKAARDAAAK